MNALAILIFTLMMVFGPLAGVALGTYLGNRCE